MSKKKTTEEFIIDAVAKHGTQYQYTKVVYKTNKDKVIITCPKHGDFNQRPNDHLIGNGCPECAKSAKGIKISKTKSSNFRTFIEWNDYIKIKYPKLKLVSIIGSSGARDGNMELECTIHSHTFTTSNATVLHNNKHLCPICVKQTHQKQSDTFTELNLYVYLYFIPSIGMYKLGVSKDPSKRLKIKADLIWTKLLPKDEAINFEHWIHNTYIDYRYCGTVKLISSGNTELYTTKILLDCESIYKRFRDSIEQSIV